MTRPTITALPTPPNRQNGAAEFAARADEFLSALPNFGEETNAAATYIDGRVAAAQQSATNAQSAASTAQGHATASNQAKLDAQAYAQQTAEDRQAVETAITEGPVILVNGQSGIVNLDADSVGAAYSDLSNVDSSDVRSAAGIGTNAVGNRTVSTANPSGGENGDIWLKV